MADTLVERFRTWRARNPRGIFAKTVDIRCVSDHQPDFTLTTRCDSHIIAALDGKSDPPCGVIRFRASAGYCNQCDDEFERDLDEIVPPDGLTVAERDARDFARDTLDPHDINSIAFDAWAGDAPLPEPFAFEEFSPVGRSIRDAIIEDAATDPAYKAAYVAALQDDLDAVFDDIAYQEAHRYCDQFFHGDDGLYDFSDPQDDWSPREDDYNEYRGW